MKKKLISVIGLGYVGLPLITELSKYFNCTGFDTNKKKIELLKKKIDPTKEIKNINLLKKIFFTNNSKDLKKINTYILCIPTPIYNNHNPDLSLLKKASAMVGKNLRKKDLVIFESTVYPGVTEEICIPILEKFSNLKWKKDFNVGYSPERINPGDKLHTISNTFKIVAGDTKKTLKDVKSIYEKITKVYPVENIKIAEASKVIENAQRDINIAFVNELSMIFSKMNINIHSVLSAASTKWNFLNFKPGLVGGHCIGIDPYYLAFKAKQINFNPLVLLSGRKINENMTSFVFKRICKNLKPNSKILFMGLSFKENCGDIRNSKNLELLNMLKKKFRLNVNDELVSKNDLKELNLNNIHINIKKLKNKKFDAIILPQVHDYLKNNRSFKIESLVKKNGFIYDLKNFLNRDKIISNHINYLNI